MHRANDSGHGKQIEGAMDITAAYSSFHILVSVFPDHFQTVRDIIAKTLCLNHPYVCHHESLLRAIQILAILSILAP